MFDLSEEEIMIRNTARDFAESELKPKAAKRDKECAFPLEEYKKLGELGFMGVIVDEKYGGTGLNTFCLSLILEEICRGCASTGVALSVHNSLVCGAISVYGTEEQKQKYLPKLATGEWLGAYALTEPNAGSDAANQQTSAVLQGDHYVLNGTKIFITSGNYADVFILFASNDRSKGSKGISAFIIEKNFKGFRPGKKEEKLGLCASDTTELVLENCIVPKSNLLGKEGDGFKIALERLDNGRIGIAAQAVGIAQACFEEAVKYSQIRQQFGKPLCEFQAIQFKIANMATELTAARLLVRKAARMKDAKVPFSMEASQAKLFATEAAGRIADEALQIHGGYGYTKDYPIERLYRDARAVRIYEGASEIQRIVIAKRILKD